METINMVFLVAFLLYAAVVTISWNLDRIRLWWDGVTGRWQTDKLLELYEEIWNGDPADRQAAWFRTIEHLRRWNYPQEMITEAEIRQIYERHQAEERSDYTVRSNGRIVKVTEITGRRSS